MEEGVRVVESGARLLYESGLVLSVSPHHAQELIGQHRPPAPCLGGLSHLEHPAAESGRKRQRQPTRPHEPRQQQQQQQQQQRVPHRVAARHPCVGQFSALFTRTLHQNVTHGRNVTNETAGVETALADQAARGRGAQRLAGCAVGARGTRSLGPAGPIAIERHWHCQSRRAVARAGGQGIGLANASHVQEAHIPRQVVHVHTCAARSRAHQSAAARLRLCL